MGWPLVWVGFLFWVLSAKLPEGSDLFRKDLLVFFLGVSFLLGSGWMFPKKSRVPVLKNAEGGAPLSLMVLGVLFLLLASGTTRNNWSYFPGWNLPGTHGVSLEESWIFRASLLALGFACGVRFAPARLKRIGIPLLTALAGCACLLYLWKATGFRPLYSVDHPSFYYRYATFLEGFPDPGFYDPNWNAGRPVPFLVASGVWAIGLLWFPILSLFSLDTVFTPILAFTFILLVPLSGYAAARMFGHRPTAGLITALLFLTPGLRFFTHILNYGTVPSMFCLCLMPLLLAMIWKVFHTDRLSDLVRTCCALGGVGLLFLCWPGSILLGVPLGVSLLMLIPRWTVRRWIWLFITGGVLFLLLTPLALVPIRYSPIQAFFEISPAQTFLESLEDGRHLLGGLLQGVHPLLLGAGALGVFLDPNRERRRFTCAFCGTAVLLAGWGEEIRPLLQSERMLVPVVLIAAIPGGDLISRLLTVDRTTGVVPALTAVWLWTFLLLGAYQGTRIYGNREVLRTRTQPAYMQDLTAYLAEEVPRGTRVLIAGEASHGFGGGKVAALPLMIDREMIACDYYGFSPKLVEYQCPPRKVLRRGPAAVKRYLELHKVSYVMTHHASWKEALHRHPDWYLFEREFDSISVFRVRSPPADLIGASGRVESAINELTLWLDSPAEEVVLKYNWADGWKAEPEVELFPADQDFDLTFIGVRPAGARHITLRFDP